jgi:pilus assembly protein FimV
MQAEVRAQEMAQRAAEEAAKAPPPPPPPEPAWWEANEALLAAIAGLPLAIALLLLWRRRRDATTDAPWRVPRPPAARAPPPPAPGLRNAPAGLTNPARATASTPTPTEAKVGKAAADRNTASVLAVSELSQVTEEARVYVALGRHDRAIEVLNEHVRQTPRSMPAAWLMLLDLCHAHGRREEFRRLAEEFHVHFNVQTPSWEGFAPGEPDNGGLELYPQVARQITELWRKPECHAYLERLLCDNREGRRNGFPLAAYADILLLLQILDASAVVDIDSDLVQDGKLDLAPGAADTAPPPAPAKADARRPRKPMPPDPAAATRPVQQPIRFEFDADAATRDPPKKPRA